MQIDLESSTLSRRALVLPFREELTAANLRSKQSNWKTTQPTSDLLRSHRTLVKLGLLEQIAWLGLALGSLGVVVLSCWF
jgi:hypothetical protein